ncbi:hypothetical protein [Algibacter sp. PT7-4]|uniref:hypothetical protein n=1 Tax=Algibacter ulvanivorans TaxID=3400999 RepID=UPI003AABB4C3
MKTLKVKIVKSQASMWYVNKIHENFKVTNTSKNYYKYIGNQIIFKCDAVEI